MPTVKHSKQRDAIMEYLTGNKEHPTADLVCLKLRRKYPNMSLGTVYRNLSLLTELGMIQKISVPGSPDHYDYNTAQHYHFICTKCGKVEDLKIRSLGDINHRASKNFDGVITEHVCQFYGLCSDCK